ncbi:MAG: macro domain-containing protein [Chlamydiales bacterium]
MTATNSIAPFPDNLYFYANHETIDAIVKTGIWWNTPTIESIEPVDASSILLLGKENREIIATDLQVKKCVHLHSSLFSNFGSQNLASIFVLEIDPKKLKACRDCYRIKKIGSTVIDVLKNMMVDRIHIQSISVFSKASRAKLRDHFRTEGITTKVVYNPYIFGMLSTHLLMHNDFVIHKQEPIATSSSLSQPSCEVKPLISIKEGNLLDSNMQTLVNTVNCVGVMGKGIALSFKKSFPMMFEDYSKRCSQKKVKLGKPYCFHVTPFKFVINFPTKGHWKQNSRIENIIMGLKFLVAYAKEWGIESMAIPPLGCGNGGLSWDEVRPIMFEYLSQLNIPIEIYAPHDEAVFGHPLKRQRLLLDH